MELIPCVQVDIDRIPLIGGSGIVNVGREALEKRILLDRFQAQGEPDALERGAELKCVGAYGLDGAGHGQGLETVAP